MQSVHASRSPGEKAFDLILSIPIATFLLLGIIQSVFQPLIIHAFLSKILVARKFNLIQCIMDMVTFEAGRIMEGPKCKDTPMLVDVVDDGISVNAHFQLSLSQVLREESGRLRRTSEDIDIGIRIQDTAEQGAAANP